ncbi:putative phospholipid-transporting ATPase DRS2 [Tritrichomonas foetus]|uniref:Phospholipid-transporting ATPase n=1 Tax=Tritrichomonas foetus TaxID=1144522 RepID=A0A1J4KN40_9EUKA|nr:putative phospholipid-transporting ATPase DRS2 [Tritrichomonas foetus]|eukprot:OHT10805.1 putative phospholipid-transporting ATPase DRS2 [Tritrichomonas foetus]
MRKFRYSLKILDQLKRKMSSSSSSFHPVKLHDSSSDSSSVNSRRGQKTDSISKRTSKTAFDLDPNREIWATIEVNGLDYPKGQININSQYPGQVGNEVRTTRYRWYTFIPLTLYEQYRVLSNIYYILVLIVSFLPMSPLSYLFQLVPMVVVLIISMIKSGVEDLIKHFDDKKRNNAPAFVYRNGDFVEIKASEIKVGDILRITEDSMVPADCLYVGSKHESSLCYYSETNLNGETAVKTMQPHPAFSEKNAIEEVTTSQYFIDLPEPDRDLTRFDARLKNLNKFWPISIHNVLLRGVSTHYTDEVLCVVLRTGHDTKIMKNIKTPPAKRTQFDKNLNRILIIVFIFKMILCLISTFLGVEGDKGNSFPLIKETYSSYGSAFLEYFTQYFVLYSYLFPISLTVTIEIIRLFHKCIVTFDPLIYDPEFGHAYAHNSNVIVQLGQVTHILSDKTGTLTENKMELLKIATNEGKFDAVDFLNTAEGDNTIIEKSLNMLIAMAICNNVIVHKKRNGKLEYNADSPDEAAFVSFAAKCGVKLIARGLNSLSVDINGKLVDYEILADLPFSSERKRMSIVVKSGDNPAIIYTKGADNIMAERIDDFKQRKTEENQILITNKNEIKGYDEKSGNNKSISRSMSRSQKKQNVENQDIVNEFASLGLRTLVFASKEIPDDALNSWLKNYREAEAALNDRDNLIFNIAAMIETNLKYIGISGVEDRLQDEVPATIQWVRNAGIKLWVLTGDKLETAIAIGRTSGVIRQDSEMMIISARNETDVEKALDKYIDGISSFTNPVLVMTADSVEYASTKFSSKFMELANHCDSVILCRVSPFMKAQVTHVVKDSGAHLLAVGDGANDVGMIQVAHVGVGIFGREGSQAAMSSDFAIPRFKFLRRLMMVHGHWNYRRLAYVAIIMVYKNVVFIFAQLWFSFYTLWSPTSFYTGFVMSCFNLIFTALPPFIFGFWEQDLDQITLLHRPELYKVDYDPMSTFNLFYYLILGLFQSLCSYFGPFLMMRESSLIESGLLTYLIVVYTVVIQIIIWHNYHNWWTFGVYAVNIVLAIPIIVVYCYCITTNMVTIVEDSMARATFWMVFIVGIAFSLLPSFIWEYTWKRFSPTPIRIFEERTTENPKKVAAVHNWALGESGSHSSEYETATASSICTNSGVAENDIFLPNGNNNDNVNIDVGDNCGADCAGGDCGGADGGGGGD